MLGVRGADAGPGRAPKRRGHGRAPPVDFHWNDGGAGQTPPLLFF